MSPQPSNRDRLIQGTLRCLQRLPLERITARVIAEEAGANLGSITYHFGSKDVLVTEAVIEGLDRWLLEVSRALDHADVRTPGHRFRRASEVIDHTRRAHRGLFANYVAALGIARHDRTIRVRLAAGLDDARRQVARVLDLDADQAGDDAGGLTLALFHGLMIQSLLDESFDLPQDRLDPALRRLAEVILGE